MRSHTKVSTVDSQMATSRRSDPVVEVEFALRDPRYPFTGLTAHAGCTFELVQMTPRPGGRYAEYFEVVGADAERIESFVDGSDDVDASLIDAYQRGCLFEFLVSGSCPAFSLAERGALPRDVRGEAGEGRILAEIPAGYDAAEVVEAFLKEYPDASLVSKREREALTPPTTASAVQHLLEELLTDRQREVIETALDAGYYEWPRGATGEEVAETLGISSATFSEHVHAAERNLLCGLFAERRADLTEGLR